MSILSVVEIGLREGTFHSDWKRTMTRVFQVRTSSRNDGLLAVAKAKDPSTGLRVPFVGEHYDDGRGTIDYGAFVVTSHPKEVELVTGSGSIWEVTAEYGPYDPNTNPKNPLDRVLKVSWGTNSFEIVIYKDVKDEALTNSAGDYFDPPVTGDNDRPVLVVSKAEASFDPLMYLEYKDAINEGPFWGFEPEIVKFRSRKAERVRNQDANTPNGYYYEVTYEFEVEPDGWVKSLLDQGFRTDTGSGPLPICEGGVAITSPKLLDGKGGVLADGAEPVFLDYDTFKRRDFNVFELTNPDDAPQ